MFVVVTIKIKICITYLGNCRLMYTGQEAKHKNKTYFIFLPY